MPKKPKKGSPGGYMPRSPYFHYIQTYFPENQWQTADCISVQECPPDWEGYPQSCVGNEGMIDCGHGPQQARSWGIFQILDACWSPHLNPDSPFTAEQWAKVLDPNVNTWMASVIWSYDGWKPWTTCELCDACEVPGGAIPHPEGPLEAPEPPPPPYQQPVIGVPSGAITGGLIVAGVGLMLGSIITLERSRSRA